MGRAWFRARAFGNVIRPPPMILNLSSPPPDPLLRTPRPSKIDSLKRAASGPSASAIAFFTALSGLIAAYQSYQESSATARLSYETLKKASDTNTARIDACQQGQTEMRAWVEELSNRLERRQATTERAITRKVTKAAAPPSAAPAVEPAPKAPPAPSAPAPASLPSFERLGAAAP